MMLLAYVVKINKAHHKQRQKIGMTNAKDKGKAWGRKKLSKPENYEEVKRRWQTREITLAEAGKLVGVSTVTFRRWLEADRLQNEEKP